MTNRAQGRWSSAAIPSVFAVVTALAAGLACALAACGSSHSSSGAADASQAPNQGIGLFDEAGTFTGDTDGAIGSGDDGGAVADAFVLPDTYVPTEKGGYALGAPIAGNGSQPGIVQNDNTANCSLVVGVVRDFGAYEIEDGGHPDFERFGGAGATLGLVQKAIGVDRKPVYGGECDDNGFPNPPCPFGQQMTTQANFDEWYRYTPGVNDPYLVYLQFVPNGNVYTFESTNFFPLDGAGFGNTPGFAHNYSFTTELHLKFTYGGGETFTFTGDDDLWVFIDGQLAIDLGGLHTPVTASVSLDTLGLTKGSQYDIELFNAERKTVGSNFRVDTNLAFTNCGTVPPDSPR
jgi:fibro-slime domain-containing protein